MVSRGASGDAGKIWILSFDAINAYVRMRSLEHIVNLVGRFAR